MKEITRKHLWPAALVAALAVVGVLAAFVVLTVPERGTAEAQGTDLCDLRPGSPLLAALIEAEVCEAAATATPAPTTGGPEPTAAPGTTPGMTPGMTPGGPDPVAPGQTPGATPEPSVCDQTGSALAALIQIGLCMEPTATPAPTATPTMAPPTATPEPTMAPTATPEPTMAPTGMPTRLTVSVDSNRTGVVELDWAAVAGAEGYLVVVYDIAAEVTVGSLRMVDADSLETEVTELTSGKEYIFALAADFGAGSEPRYSGSVYITQKVTWTPSGS